MNTIVIKRKEKKTCKVSKKSKTLNPHALPATMLSCPNETAKLFPGTGTLHVLGLKI